MSRAERRHDEIEQTKRRVMSMHGSACVVCGNPATQCGHVLPQDVLHLAKYGAAVIHHPANMRPVCSLRCNAKVQVNCRAQPIMADQWAERVREIIEEEKECRS